MNAKDAKKISLIGYLYSLGHSPLSRRGEHFLYLSPLREEKHPSFQVHQTKNIWVDYGMGRGGTIIDFALLYYNLSEVSDALKKIGEKAGEITPVSFSFHSPGSFSGIDIIKVKPLENNALIDYLKERGINPVIAKKEVKEIYFKQNGKNYFALAFENRSGGYEIRNRYFKGCIPPKDITIICNESDTCNVFEGFIDYLSYLTLKEQNSPVLPSKEREDYIILNSVFSLSKALNPLKAYRTVTCFFDHDKGGETAQKELRKYIPELVDDSRLYSDFNDLNDYLCSRLPIPEKNQKQQINPSKKVSGKSPNRRSLR